METAMHNSPGPAAKLVSIDWLQESLPGQTCTSPLQHSSPKNHKTWAAHHHFAFNFLVFMWFEPSGPSNYLPFLGRATTDNAEAKNCPRAAKQ